MHEIDSGHHSEVEFLSRAHVGENFPGSTSYTALAWNWKVADALMAVKICIMISMNNNNNYGTLF
jgi:hypothetical protein